MVKTLFNGLKFGMLLQFAVGPICLFVFSTANTRGLADALTLTAAVTLVDALYITLAGIGIARFLGNAGTRKMLQIFGGIILVLFGANMALGSLNVNILPNVSLFSGISDSSIFLQGLLLTASNPLTIIFWGGVLTTQISQKNMNSKHFVLFGIGCVSATVIFLCVVSLFGLVANHFLSETVTTAINTIVGLAIVFFGARMLVTKSSHIT